MNPGVRRVLEECRRWKVPVLFADRDMSDNDSSSATLTHPTTQFYIEAWARIHYVQRHVWIYATPEQNVRLEIHLLHELSHVLQGCEVEDEVTSGMLGFEYVMQRRLRLRGWTDFMENYMLNATEHNCDCHYADTWTQHSLMCRSKEAKFSIRQAQKKGILDRHGNPTYRRR